MIPLLGFFIIWCTLLISLIERPLKWLQAAAVRIELEGLSLLGANALLLIDELPSS